MTTETVLTAPEQTAPPPLPADPPRPVAPPARGHAALFQMVLIGAFCLFMVAPGVLMVRDGTLWSAEARKAVRSRDPIRRVAQYREYFQKSFGFRDALVKCYGLWQVKVLGVSSSDRVILGKDGWMFYNAENESECMRHAPPFRADEVAAWCELMEARRAWLAQQGIEYLFFVTPDKHTIYPEKLPSPPSQLDPRSRLDQLMGALAGSKVRVVDLRPMLLAEKQNHELYLKTDTHYNDRGAYLSYRAVLDALREPFPALKPRDEERVSLVDTAIAGGDLADFLGIPQEFTEVVPTLRISPPLALTYLEPDGLERSSRARLDRIVTTSTEGEVDSAMFYRDSFLTSPLPLFASHFKEASFHWQVQLDGAEINRRKPKVVIHEMVERVLMLPPPKDVNVPY